MSVATLHLLILICKVLLHVLHNLSLMNPLWMATFVILIVQITSMAPDAPPSPSTEV